MKTNDQQLHSKTTHILEWISHLIRTPIATSSHSHILSQGYLTQILKMVDHSYFQSLEEIPSPDSIDLLILIEDYIEHALHQQFKRRLWSEILKRKSFLQLLSLIMYIAVHSENKPRFISSILELSLEAQGSIKEVIEEISGCIETQSGLATTADMLNKIDELECENSGLQMEIDEYKSRVDELEEKYKILEHDYYFVENQCLSLRKEKSYVCKELDLNRFDDFVEKYKLLEQDLDEAYEELKYDQSKIKELENTKQDCKARIMGDGELIQELNEELKTARGLCKSLRMSSGFQSPLYSNQPILTSRTLKENIPCFNFRKNQNDEASAQRKKLYNFLSTSEDQLQQEVQKLRCDLYDLREKNESLNEQVLSLKEMNRFYKENHERVSYANRQRENLLMELQMLHRQFTQQFKEEVLSN